ncbi:thiamine pyrophosphate-binding protein [Zavarzinia compransoris]|uniref:2-succinyl-5-enolpyruvyl-6-hydroxy-3-cyclohexene-1-carboxylate synthase n=1 Tax=Zavarzinia compransoris TaxID=1264899 RepID=A0A317E5R8_9PROT|nr:thiamine pyrophosphate-binding protein [Zavarzinia compransoris]PWR21540.1 2-succinyl-5-enolpyruvyl-6-hydroxy-3-cyclohexene-1-carboxylate synthase [Zavarzinia compransoris]TDP45693.1 2-succinyl-5-enolpyruvyl-6-hydroxy-3-cyclohexene-1-carboxylate synthase [Zavarzinia compransoris]
MTHYTDEKQAQVVIALLKGHGIRHVIASPGTTNMAFVGSIQTDPFFRVYSAVDERSAAYMACGLAAELDAPVVLSCTGATASRNYMPGLTEAFYRKLPVLALTAMQGRDRAGHHIAQVIDRSSLPKDVVTLSVDLPVVKDADDIWACEMKVNRAILELTRRGGGPVHINLPTTYSRAFNEQELPAYRLINRWTLDDGSLPVLGGRVGVFIGAHKTWTAEATDTLDRFCEINDAAVFCDHTSGYHGKYRILSALIGGQEGADQSPIRPDVMIHIGEVSGDYETHSLAGKEVWRVSPDGEIRDTFRKLRHVFEMSEQRFFSLYSQGAPRATSFHETCKAALAEKRAKMPDLPFSNLWLASQFAHRIPEGAVVHFAILNSLRAWNFFDLPEGVRTASNVGGFGIDGCMSSLVGASLADPDRLFFLVTGDLAFFYDMNSLGSRHLGPNVRILLVNNGKGTEFTQHNHPGSAFGDEANRFIAADGHFGQKSRQLVKGYAEALGMEYVSISGKQEGEAAAMRLLAPGMQGRPILVEAFVDASDESNALKMIRNLDPSRKMMARQIVKGILGPGGIRTAKRILGR